MPHLPNGLKVIPLKCIILTGTLFLAKNIVGVCHNIYLPSINRQWQQHPNTSCPTLRDIRLSRMFLWVFTIHLEPQSHCSQSPHLLIIADQDSFSLQTLPGEPCPLAKSLTSHISLALTGFCLLHWVINSYEL